MGISKTDRQRLFLDNLAATRNVASALAAAGITYSTLSTWLADLSFRKQFDQSITNVVTSLPGPTPLQPQSTRRSFLRTVADKTVVVFGGGILIGVIGNEAHTLWRARKTREQLRRNALIPVSDMSNPESALSVAPADNHPHQSLAHGQSYFETELRLANDYWVRFFGHLPTHRQIDKPEIGTSDSVLVLGSPVSNSLAREALGDPRDDAPTFVRKSIDGGLEFNLHWAYHLPRQTPEMLRNEPEGTWKFSDQRICSADGQKPFTSIVAGSRSKKEIVVDYLLMSVLPRSSANAGRLLIVGGLHRPGTKAMRLLMDGSCDDEIERLTKMQGVDLSSYYQALFEVSVKEGNPVSARLYAAKALVTRRV